MSRLLRMGAALQRRLHGAAVDGAGLPPKKPIFFDMRHSNNAARIRLWLELKGSMRDAIETRTVTYPELKSEAFRAVNPLQKVPALIRPDGATVFEADVILTYLEDRYEDAGPAFTPPTAEGRQEMRLITRCHDLYVASPNTSAPGFSHSQGAMYLSHGWHGPERGMDLRTRSAKLEELWRQLLWLESRSGVQAGPYLLGAQLSLADLTWFPTAVFMEFMLPRFFGWPKLFEPEEETPTPALALWYQRLRAEPAFAAVHEAVWTYWEEMEAQGQFEPIKAEMRESREGLKFYFGTDKSEREGLKFG